MKIQWIFRKYIVHAKHKFTNIGSKLVRVESSLSWMVLSVLYVPILNTMEKHAIHMEYDI